MGVYKKYYISGNTEIEGNYKLGKKDGEIVEEIIYQEEIIILEE